MKRRISKRKSIAINRKGDNYSVVLQKYMKLFVPGFVVIVGLFIYFYYNQNQSSTTISKTAFVSRTTPEPTSEQPTSSLSSSQSATKIIYDYSPQDWQPDAYLIAKTKSDGVMSTAVASGEVYASHNTTDYLVHDSECCGDFSPGEPIHYNHKILTKSQIAGNDFFSLDFYNDALFVSQLADNQPLTDSQKSVQPVLGWTGVAGADQKVTPMTYVNFSFASENAPRLINNWPSIPNSTTINNKTFSADRWTVQVNNSQKYGTLYNIIFSTRDKVTASATISSTGNLISFKSF